MGLMAAFCVRAFVLKVIRIVEAVSRAGCHFVDSVCVCERHCKLIIQLYLGSTKCFYEHFAIRSCQHINYCNGNLLQLSNIFIAIQKIILLLCVAFTWILQSCIVLCKKLYNV